MIRGRNVGSGGLKGCRYGRCRFLRIDGGRRILIGVLRFSGTTFLGLSKVRFGGGRLGFLFGDRARRGCRLGGRGRGGRRWRGSGGGSGSRRGFCGIWGKGLGGWPWWVGVVWGRGGEGGRGQLGQGGRVKLRSLSRELEDSTIYERWWLTAEVGDISYKIGRKPYERSIVVDGPQN